MDIKNEKDINLLIESKTQEDTNIEYKSRKTFSERDFDKELAKDVSAMANADGGIIIYGIEEEGHFPKTIDWINVNEDKGYKERIEQIIGSKIFRKIEDVKVEKVLSDDKSKFVIIINIPKSDTTPHQVHFDSEQRRYYRRYGSTTSQTTINAIYSTRCDINKEWKTISKKPSPPCYDESAGVMRTYNSKDDFGNIETNYLD